ncbi:4Fe-4S dicluster domain-containing protein [Thermincola ferriacetica]
MANLSKFIDTSRCTACRGCQTACKNWNQLPAEILEFKGYLQTHEDTSPQTFTYVVMKERLKQEKMDWLFLKRQCMHCTEAACEKVCPENAIFHTAEGAVVVDREKCIGCGYCAQYCPFGVPKINEKEKKMYKCHLCSDRISNNLQPACATTCPLGAIRFGERNKLVAEAKKRLTEVKKQYPNANLYGLDDQFLQGTGVFYLLLEEPEFYGLPAKPAIPVVASIWQDVIQPIGKMLPVGVLGAIFASAVSNRIMKNNHGDHHESERGEEHGQQ